MTEGARRLEVGVTGMWKTAVKDILVSSAHRTPEGLAEEFL